MLLMMFKPDVYRYVADQNVLDEIKYRCFWSQAQSLSFSACFNRRKSKNPMYRELKEKYIQWLKYEINRSAKDIVGGGKREDYHYVADHIVVLGEILLSIGKISSIEQFCQQYKLMYNSKRAFKSELDERMKRL